jgi:O-antigen/teichoic acid export membrane protein
LLALSTNYGLRSTGLTVFAGRIVSAFTGLLFNLMVARWLSVQGFGTWEVIITLVTISSFPVGTVSYWATRDVARGKMIGRTAFLFGMVLSSIGLALYFGFSFVTYSRIAASLLPFLLGALLVPLSYWSGVANSIVQGHRPAAFGYSLVISEFAKLGVAYTALYVYRLGIEGVIVGLMAAYLVQSLVSTYLVRVTIAERFDPALTRRWSRLAWLPGISYLPTSVAVADTFLAAVAFGTTIVGYYQIAFIIASVVGYSSSLAFSLYPLLLKGGDQRLPAITIEFTLLFSVPMAAGSIVLAGPILFLFGAKYLPGALGLEILGVMFAIATVSGVVDQTLLGTERVDLDARPKFWDLLRSNLLYVPLVTILAGVLYLVALYASLWLTTSAGYSDSTVVAVWASMLLAMTVGLLMVKVRRARRFARLVPGVSVVYYLIAASLMALVVYAASGPLLNQGLGTVTYGIRLLALSLGGGAIYFGALFTIDRRFRELARSFLSRLL